MMCFGIASALLAAILPAKISGLAGWLYAGIGIYHWIAGSIMGKKEKLIFEKIEREAAANAASA
jgi:hypothetical protein